ncbi:MAG: RdgB/HAM1 family non-canonical purine NTP pyrophosphatase [Proteobacteria bacterium]|nr:RdgB/HAM1 family non-canonical purine NTP pyrophosphatase [Pseudomonadota bacterium]
MTRLVLASSNRGKLAELGDLLAPAGYELVAQSDLHVGDADETGSTFIENAIIKTRHAAHATGLPALADDSGLVVDALGGEPGLRSARFAGRHGDDAANNALLIERLRDVPDAQRGAHFYCVLVLLRSPSDPQPLIAEGVWRGRILHAPRGGNGFGYDPLFQPDGHACSSAELEPAHKNAISHRGQALAMLRERLSGAHKGSGR